MIEATGYSGYYLSNESSVEVLTIPPTLAAGETLAEEEWTKFSSTQTGTGKDNPKHPHRLTKLQMTRSVSFVYSSVKMFRLKFSIGDSPAGGGRNVIFGGSSSLTDALCS